MRVNMAICCAVGCTNRSDRGNNGEISFHRFPKDPNMRRAWTLAVRRQDWLPSSYTVICSDHFEESCYIKTVKKNILSEDSIPTLFPTHTTEYTVSEVVVGKDGVFENGMFGNESESSALSSEESEDEQPFAEFENATEFTHNPEINSDSSKEVSDKPPGSAPHVCYISRIAENDIPDDSNDIVDNIMPDYLNTVVENDVPDDSKVVLKRKLETVLEENVQSKRHLKTLQQKHRRNAKRIARLEEMVNSFKTNRVIDEDTMDILNSIPGPDRERLLHQLCTNQSKAFLENDMEEFSSSECVSDASDNLSDGGIKV